MVIARGSTEDGEQGSSVFLGERFGKRGIRVGPSPLSVGNCNGIDEATNAIVVSAKLLGFGASVSWLKRCKGSLGKVRPTHDAEGFADIMFKMAFGGLVETNVAKMGMH